MTNIFMIDDIFYESHGRWDGKYKFFTKNCGSCRFYSSRADNEDRCYWGVAWKRLVVRESPKKCQYYGLPSPREKNMVGEQERKRRICKRLKESDWKPDTNKPSYYYDLAEGRWNKE